MSLVPGPTHDVPSNKAWTRVFTATLPVQVTCGLGRYSASLSKESFSPGQQKSTLVMSMSAFLLPTLCMPWEKEICLVSSPALRNGNGHGTSHRSLSWDWIQIFFECDRTSSLEDVWALDLGSFHFWNTTFWSASLGLLKSLQMSCGFPPFSTGFLWFLSLEFTKERPLCFLLQEDITTRLIRSKVSLLNPWSEMFYFKDFILCQYAFSRSYFISPRLCYVWSWPCTPSFP